MGGRWKEPSAGLASECLGAGGNEHVEGRQVGALSRGDGHWLSDLLATDSFSHGDSGGPADWLRLRSGGTGWE